VCKHFAAEKRHGKEKRELNIFLALKLQSQNEMPEFTQLKTFP